MQYIKLTEIAVAYYEKKHANKYPTTKKGREKARKAFHTAMVLGAIDLPLLESVIEELKIKIVNELNEFTQKLF